MAEIEIYSSKWCPFCMRAKMLLESKGVQYTEYDVDRDPDLRVAMRNRANGRHTVPQIFINDEHIGGCDDLVSLDSQGRLDAKLEAA